jgi:transposase
MIIIGVDFHPEFQQIASVDTDSGEIQEKRLGHREEAEKFYRALAAAGQKVRVGMEASGHARWFERLVAELQYELWIGDAAEIRTKRVRKQKTDRQDAQLILRLLLEDRFPQIWVPNWENRDLRQLVWPRHRMVQARTRIMNQLQAVALNEGLRCKKRLWREHGRQQLESFRLAPWASRRRRDLLELMDRLNPTITELTQAIRAGSREVSGSAATEDASRSRCLDRTGLRADHRQSRALWLGQAGGQLSGAGAVGRVQRPSATAGAYHQTGEFDDALLAGGSGAGNGAQPAGVAQQISPPDDAAGTQDRQGSDGPETGGSFVLDDAPGMGLSAVGQVRFARGTARKSRWCALEHREIDWASCSSITRSSK